MQILAELLDGEGVALLPIQLESLLPNVVCRQNGLDFSDGIVLPDLEVGQLGVGVGDQVIDQFFEQRAWTCSFDLRLLAKGIAIAGQHEVAQLGDDAATAFAVLILAIGQDALEGRRRCAGLRAVDEFFDLEIERQLDVEAIAFGRPDQRPATGFRTAQDAFGFGQRFVVIAQWGDDFEAERMTGVFPWGTVEQPVEFIVSLGVLVPYLGLPAKDVVVEQLTEQPPFFIGGDFHMADFAGHVAFFIGQEKPEIAVAADQALLFEAGKTFLYPALECKFVGIDFIDAERGQVIDVRFDDVRDVANQEHALEQVDVVGFQRGVARRLVYRALGAGVNEAFD